MNKSICTLLLIVSVVIGGCGKEKIEYFDTSVSNVEEGNMYVGCPIDDGPGNDIGYVCTIRIDSDLKLKDSEGNDLTLEEYQLGDSVKVILTKPQVLSEKNLTLEVSEVQRLETAN